MKRTEKEVHILYEYNPNIIHLTGDRTYYAVANYMWNRYHHDIDTGKYDIMAARGFACRFMAKYNAEPVVMEYKGKLFLYPQFKKKK